MNLRHLLGLDTPVEVITERERLKKALKRNEEAAQHVDNNLIDLLRRTNEGVIATSQKKLE